MSSLVRVRDCVAGEGIISHVPCILEVAQETVNCAERGGTGQGAREEPDRPAPPADLRQLSGDGIVDPAPIRFLSAMQRVFQPLGVIETQDRRVSHGAQAAARKRVVGIPFEFDRASVADLREHSATGGTAAACGRIVVGASRNHALGLVEIGDGLLHRHLAATRDHGAGEREPGGREKTSPAHLRVVCSGPLREFAPRAGLLDCGLLLKAFPVSFLTPVGPVHTKLS